MVIFSRLFLDKLLQVTTVVIRKFNCKGNAVMLLSVIQCLTKLYKQPQTDELDTTNNKIRTFLQN